MAADPQVNHLDFVSGPNATGPAGVIRVTRAASGLQASVDGGAPAALGGSGVTSIVAGTGITVDATNPAAPIVSQTAGSCETPDWFGYMKNVFETKTGLSSLAWSASIKNDFTTTLGLLQQGTGAASSILDNPVSGTGVANFLGASSGNGLAYWLENGSGRSQFPNSRTKRWMVGARIACGTVANSHTTALAGIYTGQFVGVGYVGATPSTWHYVRGTSLDSSTTTTAYVDLGNSIDTTGNVYVNVYVGNFDLTNVVANGNAGVASDVIVEAVSNLTSGAGYPIIQLAAVGGGGGADIFRADKLILCGEL